MNQVRSFPTERILSKVQNMYGVRGRTELHERVSMVNENENPEEGGLTGPRRGGKMA